jgi:hypothetical protein
MFQPREQLTKRLAQEVIELRHYSLLKLVTPQEALKGFSICRLALMKAEEGWSDIERSVMTINSHKRRNFPSQSRLRPTHDDHYVPTRLLSDGFRSKFKRTRKSINCASHWRICKFNAF